MTGIGFFEVEFGMALNGDRLAALIRPGNQGRRCEKKDVPYTLTSAIAAASRFPIASQFTRFQNASTYFARSFR